MSSIEIENAAMGHPQVAEAAVIAVPHPKWGERPLLVVALRDGVAASEGTKRSILAFLESKLAKFAVPDDVAFVGEIPHNATGKVSKLTLRGMFKDYKAPLARL